MKHTYFIVAAMLSIAILAAACSPAPTPEPTVAFSTSIPTVSASSSAATSGTTSSLAVSATSGTTSSVTASATSGTTSSVSASAATQMPPTGPATVNLSTSTSATLGTFLVDAKGMTLYTFAKDTPNTSTCTGQCASLWPPYLTLGTPVAGTGVVAAQLGTTTRADGSTQVTYFGWPLYYYSKDTAMGDTNGQNVGSSWFVITAAGVQVNK